MSRTFIWVNGFPDNTSAVSAAKQFAVFYIESLVIFAVHANDIANA